MKCAINREQRVAQIAQQVELFYAAFNKAWPQITNSRARGEPSFELGKRLGEIIQNCIRSGETDDAAIVKAAVSEIERRDAARMESDLASRSVLDFRSRLRLRA